MTLFGKIVLIDDQINMSSLGWAKIQYNCPCKKQKFGLRDKGSVPSETWNYAAVIYGK